MEMLTAKNMAQLLDIIGASGNDWPGPVIIRVETWAGKTIEAVFAEKLDNKKFLVGDVESKFDIFVDVEPIRPYAERLLATGESFFTVTGTGDLVCSLEWRLAK